MSFGLSFEHLGEVRPLSTAGPGGAGAAAGGATAAADEAER